MAEERSFGLGENRRRSVEVDTSKWLNGQPDDHATVGEVGKYGVQNHTVEFGGKNNLFGNDIYRFRRDV